MKKLFGKYCIVCTLHDFISVKHVAIQRVMIAIVWLLCTFFLLFIILYEYKYYICKQKKFITQILIKIIITKQKTK